MVTVAQLIKLKKSLNGIYTYIKWVNFMVCKIILQAFFNGNISMIVYKSYCRDYACVSRCFSSKYDLFQSMLKNVLRVYKQKLGFVIMCIIYQ